MCSCIFTDKRVHNLSWDILLYFFILFLSCISTVVRAHIIFTCILDGSYNIIYRKITTNNSLWISLFISFSFIPAFCFEFNL